MTGETDGIVTEQKPSPRDRQQERLEAALRENLRRRKAQARARAAEPQRDPAVTATPGAEPNETESRD